MRVSSPANKDLNPPQVTAIILNWCDEIVTADCIRSLIASDYPALKILLVDNGSTDDSFKELKRLFPKIDFLQTGKNLGYAGGNNRGIEHALVSNPDYILILNNDTVLEPVTISKLVDVIDKRDRRIGGVAPKILYHDKPDRIWYAGGEFSPLLGLGLHWHEGDLDESNRVESVRNISFMTGACCLLSTEALRELNGFDEDFFAYVEDADLSIRMMLAGYQLYYQPEARVFHKCPLPGTPPSPFQIRQRDRNRRRIMRKHSSFGQRLPFLARFLVTRAILLLGYTFTGDWERALAILEGMREG